MALSRDQDQVIEFVIKIQRGCVYWTRMCSSISLWTETEKNADLSNVRSRRYRFNPKMSAEIESQVQSMLQSGVIEHSKTDILSPIVLARKRDGTQLFCLDFRSLNTELQDETFHLMTPKEAMIQLKNSKFFSVIDMCSAFNQIPLTEDSRRLTGFQTSSGVYQFQRLFWFESCTACFSESNAPCYRQLRIWACTYLSWWLSHSHLHIRGTFTDPRKSVWLFQKCRTYTTNGEVSFLYGKCQLFGIQVIWKGYSARR